MSRLASVFLAFAVSLSAHHSIDAIYDRSGQADFKVIVTKVEWINPHVRFVAILDLASGATVEWQFELGSANGLKNDGWTKDTLKQGDSITVTAFPAKDGSPKGSVGRIVWPDGRTKENKDSWAMSATRP